MDLNQIHDEILRKRLGTDPRVPDETGAISRPSVGGEISNHYLQLARELPTTVQKEQEKKNIFQRAGAFVRNVITGAPKQEDQIQRQTDAYLQEIARGVRLEEPEPRKGIIKEFTDASKRTFWNTISQIEGFRGLTAALHGREKAVVKSRLDDAEALQYKAGQYQATIQRIEDVRGLGDFARWGVSTGVEMMPIVGLIMLGSLTGGATAPVAAKALFGKKAVTGTVSLLGRQVSRQALTTAAGSYIGSFTVGYGSYASTIFESGIRKGADIEDAKRAALIWGAPASAVSVIFPAMVGGYMLGAFGQSWFKSLASKAFVPVVSGMAFEGVAEGFAESFTIAGEKMAMGQFNMEALAQATNDPEYRSRIINAMAGGALMGTMFGAFGGAKGVVDHKRAQATADHILDVADQVQQSTRSPIIEDYLIRRYDEIAQHRALTAEETTFVNYLKELQKTEPKDTLGQALEPYYEQMISVWDRGDDVNMSRFTELLDKADRTFAEDMELAAITFNKPTIVAEAIQGIDPAQFKPTPDGLTFEIIKDVFPGEMIDVKNIVDKYGDDGIAALDSLVKEGILKYTDDGTQLTVISESMGYPEAGEFIDSVDEVFKGRHKIRVPEEIKTDVRETLGKGNYARIFTTDKTAPTLDEVAERMGMTSNELIDELSNRALGRRGRSGYFHDGIGDGTFFSIKEPKIDLSPKKVDDKNTLKPPDKVKSIDGVLKEKAPYIYELKSEGIDWNKLNPEQKEAVKMWHKQKDTQKQRLDTVKKLYGDEAHKVISEAVEADKTAEEFVRSLRVEPTIPKGLEPLAKEARKYKSAEEFVKGKFQSLFRGGEVFDTTRATPEGVSLAKTTDQAQRFFKLSKLSGEDATIQKLFIPKDAKVMKWEDIPKRFVEYTKEYHPTERMVWSFREILKEPTSEKQLVEYARKQGYDAIDLTRLEEAEIRIVNAEIIKTEAELTDIWNKAVKGVEPTKELELLIQEARKYKTAEEFVKAQPTYYHGTAEEFLDIKSMRQLRTEGVDVEASNIGGDSPFIHLTKDKKLAENYAKARMVNIRGLPRTLEYKIQGEILDLTKHPADYTTTEKKILSKIGKELTDKSGGRGPDAFIGAQLSIAGKERTSYMDVKDVNISFRDIEHSREFYNILKREGYGGFKFRDRGMVGEYKDTIAAIPEAVKTKSQLTDIFYNQAVKETKLEIISLGKLHFNNKYDAMAFYEMIKVDRDMPGELKHESLRIDKDSTDPVFETGIESRKDVISPSRDLETQLNLKAKDPGHYYRILTDIAKNVFGVNKIILKAHKGSVRGSFGHIRGLPKKFDITVRAVNDFITLGHEIGHAFDHVVIKKMGEVEAKNLKNRIDAVDIETLRKNAAQLGVNLDNILKNKNKDYVNELMKVREFVSKFARIDRHKHEELFAIWFTGYLNDYSTTKLLSPKFTTAMEVAYNNDLANIRNRYTMPVDGTEVVNKMSIKTTRNVLSKFLSAVQASSDLSKAENVAYFKKRRGILQKAGDRVIGFAGLPFHYALYNKEFDNVYWPVQKYGINEVHGDFTKMFNDSGQYDAIKNMPTHMRDRVFNKFFEGTQQGVERYSTREELINEGFTEEQIVYYEKIKNTIPYARELIIETIKYKRGYYDMDLQSRREIDAQIKESVDRLEGYFPLSQSGKYIIYGETKDLKGNIQPSFRRTNSWTEAMLYADNLRKANYDYVDVGTYQKLQQKTKNKLLNRLSYFEVIRILNEIGIEKDSHGNFKDKGIQDFLEKFEKYTAKGWQQRLLARENVPGIEPNAEWGERALQDFFRDASIAHGKAKAEYLARKELMKIDQNKHPELKSRTETWLDDFLYGIEAGEWGSVRKLVFPWYLALKPSYVFQNALQPVQMISVTAEHVPLNPAGQIAKGYGLAIDYLMYRLDQKSLKKIPDSLKRQRVQAKDSMYYDLMDRAIRERVLAGQLQEKMMVAVDPTRQTMENVLGAFQNVTEIVNRSQSLAVGYDIAVNVKNMKDSEQIYDFMVRYNYEVNIPYGKHNAPFGLMNTGKMKGFLKTMIIFRTFQLHYMHVFWNKIVKGTLAQKFWGLNTLMFLGGIKAIPFFALANWLVRSATKKDLVNMVRQLFSNEEDEFIADYITAGGFSLLNMNTSQLLGIGDAISPHYDITAQIFGAGYGIIDNAIDGYEHFKVGDTGRALEHWTPTVIRNVLIARRWERDGIEFRPGFHYEPSRWEIIQKQLSFTPYSIAQQFEIRGIERYYTRRRSSLRKEYMNTYRDYLDGKKTKKQLDSVLDSIDRHNEIVEDALFTNFHLSRIEIPFEDQLRVENSILIDVKDLIRWEREVLLE